MIFDTFILENVLINYHCRRYFQKLHINYLIGDKDHKFTTIGKGSYTQQVFELK